MYASLRFAPERGVKCPAGSGFMNSVVPNINSTVYWLCGIAVASFVVGYVLIGVPLRKKGIRKKTVDLIVSSVAAICVIGGYSLYRSLI